MRLPEGLPLRITTGVNALYRAALLYWSARSPQAWLQAASYLRLRMAGHSPPVTITIAPTYRCQCRCVHCFAAVAGRKGGDELTTDQWKQVIDEAKGIGTLQVIFSGGEPLWHEDIVELVAHAHDAGLLTRVSTNGLLLTRQRVARLKRAGLTQCGVSIDDRDPAVHDRLRGLPGTFARAMEGVRNLREFGIFCKILVYASRRNVTAGLERIIEMGRELGVTSVYILLPIAAGRWDGAYHEALGDEEMARVRALQDAKFVHMELPNAEAQCCAYSKAVLYVCAGGEVTPCPYVPYALGDVREEPLADIWRRHTSALRLESRGRCPMNAVDAREALRAHAQSVRNAGRAGRGRRRMRGAATCSR